WISVAAFAFPVSSLPPLSSSVFLCLLLRLLKRDGTGVELLKPSLVSACYPPVLQLLASHRRVWIIGITVCHLLEIAASGVDSTLVMAGPGRGQPCFAYSTVRVAFGTVCGPLDYSPAVFSSGLCGFDVGSGIFSLVVSTANFKVVHGFVSIS
ncbi:unnamed protein product, partial [Brassica oleracea]